MGLKLNDLLKLLMSKQRRFHSFKDMNGDE